MDPDELARRLVAHLRERALVDEATLARAGQHFMLTRDPVASLAHAGVPEGVITAALAVAGVARAQTMALGHAPTLMGAPRAAAPVTTFAGTEARATTEARAPAEARAPTGGTQFGPWVVDGPLGSGGMAAVYLAHDDKGRRAAVKVVHPHLLTVDEARARFLREAQATAKVRDKNVVAVLDVSSGEDGKQAWLAVELVEGGSVADLLERHGKLPLAAVMEIIDQMLAGLTAAHALSVVHRDLKPDNLLITTDGVIKIADFGVARSLDATAMTQTGSTLGTPAYMSPEQARAKPVAASSDLYTVGVIAYELLIGKNPFQEENIAAVVMRILTETPAPLFEVDPTIPEAVDELVASLMQKDPALRPPDAAAVRARIKPFVDDARREHPRLLEELRVRPALAHELKRAQALSLVGAARQLLQMGPGQREAAGLCLLRARLLDDDNKEAATLLDELAAHGVAFAETKNPRIVELEAALAMSPDDPVLLQRLAQAFKQEGNVYKAAVYYRRYLRQRPEDQYVRTQLSRITLLASSTVERIAGHIEKGGGVMSASAGVPDGAAMSSPSSLASLQAQQQSASSGAQTSASSQGGALGAGDGGVVDQLRASWNVHGKKIIAAAVVVVALYAGVRGVSALLGGAQGAIDESRKGVTMPTPKNPDDEAASAALVRAQDALPKGDYGLAESEATAVLAHSTRHGEQARALLVRGRARIALNKTLGAVEDLSLVVDGFSDTDVAAEALLRRGQAKATAGDREGAMPDFERAIAKHTNTALLAEGKLERGLVYAARNDVEHARPDLKAALDLTPPSSPVHGRAREALAALP